MVLVTQLKKILDFSLFSNMLVYVYTISLYDKITVVCTVVHFLQQFMIVYFTFSEPPFTYYLIDNIIYLYRVLICYLSVSFGFNIIDPYGTVI